MQCWGCGINHMCIDCPHRGDKVRTMHSVHKSAIVEYMGINVPRIYATLDNKQVEFHSHMIKVEGKINDQPIAILIDSGAFHSFLDPKTVEKFHLSRSKLGKPWLLQLATRTKRKINEMIKACLLEMNGLHTKYDLNIIPLGL
jgi:hypothetical protein